MRDLTRSLRFVPACAPNRTLGSAKPELDGLNIWGSFESYLPEAIQAGRPCDGVVKKLRRNRVENVQREVKRWKTG